MNKLRLSLFFTYRAFLITALLLSSVAALLFLVEAKHFLNAAGDNVYPEATGIASALRWANGLPLYSNFQDPPYILTAFPPLWYLCMRGAVQAGFNNPDSLTVFARVTSLVFLAALSLLAFFWNRQRGYSREESALGPILYLAFPALLPWAVSARPDFPSLFFALAALAALTMRPKADGALLAGFLAGLCFLFRHSCVSAPTAIGLYLLLSKRWRDTILLCLGWATPVVAILWRFNAASNGALRTSFSGSNFGSMNITNAHEILTYLFTRQGYGFTGLLFALGLFGLALAWKKSIDPTGRILVFYFLLTLGLAVLGSSLAGAGENHYLEPALAATLLVPAGVAELRKNWPADSLLPAFVCVLLIVVWLPNIDVRHWQAGDRHPADFHDLVKLVEHKNVLTDVPYLAARTPSQEFLDATSLRYAEGVHRWSPAAVVSDLDKQSFDAVILHESLDKMEQEEGHDRYPRLSMSVREAIRRSYGLCYQKDSAIVYARVPRDSSGSQVINCEALNLW